MKDEIVKKEEGEITKKENENKEKKTNKLWETALEALVAVTPIIGPSAFILLRSYKQSKKASEAKDITTLSEEAERQRIELMMAEMQTKVAQEMAIAQRIQSAGEVEIEEYYESTGEGTAGVQSTSGAFTMGVTAKGNRVTKRVYRFKGQDNSVIDAKKNEE